MSDDIATAHFSVHEIPFSYHGAWLNLSPVIAEHRIAEDVHLITHRTGLNAILRLVPQISGARVDTTIDADPTTMTWQHPAGDIEAAFESIDTIRFRGSGLDLKVAAAQPILTPFGGTYFFVDPIDGALIYSSYESGRRYRITVLDGRIETFGDQTLGAAERGAIITAADSGHWEIAVEEYETSRGTYASGQSFAAVVAAARAAFTEFLGAVAPWRSDRTPAAGLAAYVLWSATVSPAGFLLRPSVLMSKHWMDKVWSWDHCFNALALAGGRPELALDQFLTPFDHQDSRGALPDSVTHSEVLYNFVKPPIHGWALQELRRRLTQPIEPLLLQSIYARLSAWTRFWLDARRVPDHVLAHYQHGNDSGWDNSTVFDAAQVIETADLAGFLTQQLYVLAELATELGLPGDSDEWALLAERMQQALFETLWAGGRFAARDPRSGRLSHAESLLNLMPIVLGAGLPTDVAQQVADRIREHVTDWGLATEPVSSPEYQPDGYWRGPIWAPSTVLLEDGLRRAGHRELADEISRKFLALCEKSGFAENFDARTGDGLRDRAYTWTASAYLLLAAAHEERTSVATAAVREEAPSRTATAPVVGTSIS